MNGNGKVPEQSGRSKIIFCSLVIRGRGKTTIARIFADILNSLEVLPIGQLVEVSRKELVAGYVGQTALAVEKYVDMAMGGVLFIDEAYTLKQGDNDQFGQEAIDTLLKLVEDRRGQFVAIAAGYTKEMGEFLSSNSGWPPVSMKR